MLLCINRSFGKEPPRPPPIPPVKRAANDRAAAVVSDCVGEAAWGSGSASVVWPAFDELHVFFIFLASGPPDNKGISYHGQHRGPIH